MNNLLTSQPLIVDKQLAVILGLKEAIVLQQINYWIEINKKKNNNFYEGKYWTYNTISEWQDEFSFWSYETVKRTLKKLRERNLIITDNFNKLKMDRTLWYTINYDELERLISEYDNNLNQSIRTDSTNTLDQNDQMNKSNETSPIPEISTESSSEISIQSVSPASRQINSNNFIKKYKRIIDKCELYSIDNAYREAVSKAIKLLLLDIEENTRVKIGYNYIPSEIVQKDIEKLDFFVIEHAINKFKEASKKIEIKNTVVYLKACIYNSIGEIQIDIDSELMYEGVIE